MNTAIQEQKRINDCAVVPAADIYETENDYILKLEMPGVVKENLEVVIDNNELEIKGSLQNDKPEGRDEKYAEYELYDYHRKFKVGNDVDRNKIHANLENGVLTLRLEKSEEVKPKKIEISVS